MRSLPQTDIYGITCEALSRGRDNLTVVRELLAAGVKIIQYREKAKTIKEKYAECLAISKMCREAGALFVVNDDEDLALLTGAGAVHVGQDDLPADAVRKLVGPEVIVGVSAGSMEEARDAVARGADYLGVGPIYRTATKEDAGEAVGLALLQTMSRTFTLPLVAIGGITPSNIKEVMRLGAACAAMISALVGAEDIAAAVRAARRSLHEGGR
ncbi:MAG: thiamine phosphate synthase [Firmicutes bacterium]|nr:thiamine phosphate synthase [Bacillota bacterium]